MFLRLQASRRPAPWEIHVALCVERKIFFTTRESSIRKIKKHIHACKLKKQTWLTSPAIRRDVQMARETSFHHPNGEKLWRRNFRLFFEMMQKKTRQRTYGAERTHLTTDERTVFPQHFVCYRHDEHRETHDVMLFDIKRCDRDFSIIQFRADADE